MQATALIYLSATSTAAAQHRIEQTIDFARDELGMDEWADLHADNAAEAAEWTSERFEPETPSVCLYNSPDSERGVRLLVDRPDRWDGTPALAKTLQYAREDSVEHVLLLSLSMANADVVEELVTAGTNVHAIMQGITLRRDAKTDRAGTHNALRCLTGETTDAEVLLAGIPHRGGRPPLGCTSENGQLAPGDDYRRVCDVLQAVEDGRLSKRRAAAKLDCVPKTIVNALDRPSLYQLDRDDE